MFVAVCIGISGRALTSNGLIQSLSGSDTETIIIRIADVMSSNGVFFTIMAGLVLAGILASTMSTADSQLLAASSSVSQNILQEVLNLKISPKTSMLIARITVVIIAVIGIVIAQDPNSSVFEIVSFAWAGFGASFGPLILCSLFWKRTNLQGAIAGMLAGGISVFVWKYGIATLGGAFAIYELLPAFIIGIIAIIVVSLLTKAPSKEIVEEFEAVRNIKL